MTNWIGDICDIEAVPDAPLSLCDAQRIVDAVYDGGGEYRGDVDIDFGQGRGYRFLVRDGGYCVDIPHKLDASGEVRIRRDWPSLPAIPQASRDLIESYWFEGKPYHDGGRD